MERFFIFNCLIFSNFSKIFLFIFDYLKSLGLSSIHTLFLREHNRIATELALVNPLWSDDKIFNEARRILIGIYQHIIYNEWVCKIT